MSYVIDALKAGEWEQVRAIFYLQGIAGGDSDTRAADSASMPRRFIR